MTARNKDKTVQDLQKLLEISRSMVATEDLDSLFNLIVERSMELLAAERATVFLYDPQANELTSRVAAGADDLRVPADRGISGATIASNAVINVPDAYADERFNPEVDRVTGFRTRNILSVPLHDYNGNLVGVLQVLNKQSGPFTAYDVNLAETLGAQAGVALQRSRLIDHYLEKQQMQRAMKLAREIQLDLLPKKPPDLPGFDIAGFTEAADDTGGDTYDFMSLPDGRWMITVADATGHGVGPALMVAETRAMLRAVSLQGTGVSAVLGTVNELLTADLDEARFVTCFFGLLEPENSCLVYASAGHGPLMFYTDKTKTFAKVPATGLPLGIMAEADYANVITHSLAPGDLAVIATDGFFEAANPDGQQFGLDRMTGVIKRDRHLLAAEIIQNLHTAVVDYTKGLPQADDLTIVIIRKT